MPPVSENKACRGRTGRSELRISSSPGRRRESRVLHIDHGLLAAKAAASRSSTTRIWTPRCSRFQERRPTLDADLVLFAMGFSGPTEGGVVSARAPRGCARALQGPGRERSRTIACRAAKSCSRPATSGAGNRSVVWAIREGRQAASSIDKFLMGRDDAALGSERWQRAFRRGTHHRLSWMRNTVLSTSLKANLSRRQTACTLHTTHRDQYPPQTQRNLPS